MDGTRRAARWLRFEIGERIEWPSEGLRRPAASGVTGPILAEVAQFHTKAQLKGCSGFPLRQSNLLMQLRLTDLTIRHWATGEGRNFDRPANTLHVMR
jgi:hypothetical protein